MGESYVCTGDYDILSEENEGTVIIDSSERKTRLRHGMLLKTSIILRKTEDRGRPQFQSPRKLLCPRRNHSNSNADSVDGWIEW